MGRVLAMGFALFCLFSSQAQKDFYFETFTTRDGLSSNEIRSLLRDSRGFLWVGTANGLNRFDGYRFSNYTPNPREENSLGGEVITALAESPDGQLWIAHNRGLDIYDPARDTFFFITPPADKKINWTFSHGSSITFLPNGYAVATLNADHVLLFAPGEFTYTELYLPDVPAKYKPNNAKNTLVPAIVACTIKSEDEVWVSSSFGIFSLEVETCTFEHHIFEGLDWNYWAGTIYQDTVRDLLWFTTFMEGLYSYSEQDRRWKSWDVPLSGYIRSSTDICAAPGGGIWINYPGILYPEEERFNPIQHIPDDYFSFPKAASTVAMQDAEGILWVGTSGGLSKLDPKLQGFHHIQLEQHYPSDYDNSVFEVFKNEEDQKWYITSFYTGQLFEYDPLTGAQMDITQSFQPALTGAGFTRIFKDSYGLTWLLANSQLYQIFLKDRKLIPIEMPKLPEGVSDRATFDIVEDFRGDLWIVKWRAGLLHFDRKNYRLSYVHPPESMGAPRAAFVLTTNSRKDAIWIGTNGNGIFSLDLSSGKWQHLTATTIEGHHINLIDINGLTMDRQDNLWIATRLGLIRRGKDGQEQLFTQEDGLNNVFLEGIRADGRGTVWLATSSGISKINIQTFEVQNFDERHGLKIDATLDYFSIQPDGTIFSGTKQGFVYFHPDSLVRDLRPPRLALLSFKSRGVDHQQDNLQPDYWQSIDLKPGENFFTIEYVGLNFTLPSENSYYFKLEGLDEDWVEAGKGRIASYTNVPPGDYFFCLKAKNKDGIWSTAEKRLAIRIAPPFWRTYWFWLLVFGIVTSLAYGIYHLYIKQRQREQRMKAEFNNKLAEVEMAALRSQMNPHFLFNCLNSINRFIQRNEPDTASAYLTKFSRLIRLVLDHSRSDTISLRDELDALRLYIELEAMRFVGRFSYVFDIAPSLETHSIDIPPMLIQPYVENAIWHGLMHKDHGDGRLTIKSYIREDRLFVEVEDNGVGRKMAALLKSKSATLYKSHGMKVTAERIEIINEIYEAKTTVEIEDLINSQGKAAGTKVTLSLFLK
mgnify:CR=1 FL=1